MSAKIALLIDAENIAYKYLKTIFDEISTNYGTVTIKRAYGDFTAESLKNWKDVVLDYAIVPIQQYSFVSDKNSSDHKMVIDAMDILYTKDVDIFCLATSDSDFTSLVTRLRESGKKVIGFGETKTNKQFTDSYNEFKYIDKLYNSINDSEKADDIDISNITPLSDIKDFIYNYISSGDGEVQLGGLKSSIKTNFSDFDERNYDYSKFSTFIDSFDEFTLIQKGNINSVILNLNISDYKGKITDYIIDLLKNGKKKHFTTVEIQNSIAKKYPNFRLKSLGYSTMKSLLKSIKSIQIDNQGKYYYKG